MTTDDLNNYVPVRVDESHTKLLCKLCGGETYVRHTHAGEHGRTAGASLQALTVSAEAHHKSAGH